jgi:hypothetical protein
MSAGDRELLVMEFVEGETFHARLERGPLPQHDVRGLGQAIASGLTAYTAIRSSSNRFSQLASWFQLAKMRPTKFSFDASSGRKYSKREDVTTVRSNAFPLNATPSGKNSR